MSKFSIKRVFRISFLICVLSFTLLAGTYYILNFQATGIENLLYKIFAFEKQENVSVSYRNLILPTGLLGLFTTMLYLVKSKKIIAFMIIFLISVELLRFGFKFTPFSPSTMANLTTPAIGFLQENVGNFRVEREWDALLPPNTWIYARLHSPSGYDPLAIKTYASTYQLFQRTEFDEANMLQAINENVHTRYLEFQNYKSPFMDLSGVKYFLALKRNESGDIDSEGQQLSEQIPLDKFSRVFEEGTVVVLENHMVLPRLALFDNFVIENDEMKSKAILLDDFNFRESVILDQAPIYSGHKVSEHDSVEFINYSANKIDIETNTGASAVLMLTDTYYPGWQAYIDKKEVEIYLANGIYRAVELPAGKHEVRFIYNPLSFKIGLWFSGAALFILLSVFVYEKTKKDRYRAS